MTVNKNLAVAVVIDELISQITEDIQKKCNIPRPVIREYMDASVSTHPKRFMMPAVEEIGRIMEDMDDEEAKEYYINYLSNLLIGMTN